MRMSNSLDPDHDLGPNCLQKLSANGTRRQIFKGDQDFRY